MVIGFVGIAIALLLVFISFPRLTRARGGKIFAFFPLFLLPVAASGIGGWFHLEQSKRTEFCMSCHVMTDYGKSLRVDDSSFVPASHFQNHRFLRMKRASHVTPITRCTATSTRS